MERLFEFRYDEWERFGSRQRFFHFLWGYLLPALDHALTRPRPGTRWVFESCGPVLDAKTRELCEWLELPYRIDDVDDGVGSPDVDECLVVPRWDAWIRSRYAWRMPLLAALHRRGLPLPVLDGMARMVELLLERAGCSADAPEGPWLLLRRSGEDSFYRKGGDAWRPQYGTSRRAIANFDALERELRDAGLPLEVYEPGKDPLREQIRRFHRAAGVVAIRGAEWSNVAWMRPGTRGVMLVTPRKRPHHLISGIAATRGVRMRLVPVDSKYPEVSGAALLRAIC